MMPNSFAIHRFNSGSLNESVEGVEGKIRVDVVGDVERLACVGRVDFEVHGGQCIASLCCAQLDRWRLASLHFNHGRYSLCSITCCGDWNLDLTFQTDFESWIHAASIPIIYDSVTFMQLQFPLLFSLSSFSIPQIQSVVPLRTKFPVAPRLANISGSIP